MNEQESKNNIREIDISKVRRIQIDGSKAYVREVRVIMKSDDVLTFKPYIRTWLRGINAHIREQSAKVLKS